MDFQEGDIQLLNNHTTMHARNEALGRLEEFIRDHFEDGRYDWSVAMVGSTLKFFS